MSVRVTVSGSFHRHMTAIYDAVGQLRLAGADILSPSDPRVVDATGDFLFVASDRIRSIELVQRRHFECIRRSDFLLVVAPDGYTGESTSGEIGAAIAWGVPVLCANPVANTTWQTFVRIVPGIGEMVAMARRTTRRKPEGVDLLVDPGVASRAMMEAIDVSTGMLLGGATISDDDGHAALRSKLDIVTAGLRSLVQ